MSWLYYIVKNVYQVLLIHYYFLIIMLDLNLPVYNMYIIGDKSPILQNSLLIYNQGLINCWVAQRK